MGDFSDFQRGQIVDGHLAGTSVTKAATRAEVSRVMTTYTNHGRTSTKGNSGQKPKLIERDLCTLKGIVSINHKILQQRWQQNFIFIMKTVSTKIVWWELHKSNSAKRLKRWCDYHKTWPSDDWKNIIWPDLARRVILHIVPTIRLGLCLDITQVCL